LKTEFPLRVVKSIFSKNIIKFSFEIIKKKGIPFFLIISKDNFIIFLRRYFLLLSGETRFSKFK